MSVLTPPAAAPQDGAVADKKGIDWDSVDLGQRPDTEIARELGVDTSTVLKARQTRGIPACGRGVGRPRLSPEQVTEARPVRLPATHWVELERAAAEDGTTWRKTLVEAVGDWLDRRKRGKKR